MASKHHPDTQHLNLRVPTALVKELNRIAEVQGLGRSEIIRNALIKAYPYLREFAQMRSVGRPSSEKGTTNGTQTSDQAEG